MENDVQEGIGEGTEEDRHKVDEGHEAGKAHDVNKVPVFFFIASALFLIWNLLGLGAFMQHVSINAEALDQLSKAEQALYVSAPPWSTATFGVAVISGVAGSLLLLIRRRMAFPILMISFLTALITQAYWLFISDALHILGNDAAIMPALVLFLAILLSFFAGWAMSRGWLR